MVNPCIAHLLLEEIDSNTFAEASTELRDRTAELQLEIEACDRGRNEIIDIAVKTSELSQNLRAKWFEADYAAKRRILEIICLNWTLDGVSLVPTMRKPFDMLAEGLVWKNSRDDWRSFEPWIAACIDAAFSPAAELITAPWHTRLPA